MSLENSSPVGRDQTQASGLARVVFAVLLGCVMSLAMSGYHVGKSNHTVYLLDALRQADPQLLANDWFTNHTIQYHGLFSTLTRLSLKWGVFDPVFLLGYLLTVLWFHISAYRVVRAICRESGGTVAVYLVSIVLLHLSAGGTGLGGFQFLQDGAFLPSNISNVAMLAGIASLMERKLWWAGLCLGVAGLFHINHAVFAPFIFLAGVLAQPDIRRNWTQALGPALLLAALCAINILPALSHLQSAAAQNRMPLPEFVEIFARLRHPHHYYPPAWPLILYVVTLWTLLPAALVLWSKDQTALPPDVRRVILAVAGFLVAATVVALLFAGAIFISERLIQLAVFRFSILYIYLACALTAWGLLKGQLLPAPLGVSLVAALPILIAFGVFVAAAELLPGATGVMAAEFVRGRWAPIGLVILLSAIAAAVALAHTLPIPTKSWAVASVVLFASISALWVKGGVLGLNYIPEDPADYIRLARWARDNTPKDALFLVPPQEQSWRYEARRAVVINLKAIPQTSTEMPEWKRRMQLVTGVQDLPSMAGTFSSTLAKLGAVYAARPAQDLVDVAKQFPHCRYIVTTATLALPRIGPEDTGPYKLYDLGADAVLPETTPIPQRP